MTKNQSQRHTDSSIFQSRPLQAEFNLSAFTDNLKQVESMAPNSRVMAVVKANAYGHGLIEMATAAKGYDLAVAVPSECEALLSAGLENRIWILEGPFSLACLEKARGTNVIWVIHSDWQIDLLKAHRDAGSSSLKVCLKLDTGMHRLGFSPDKASNALARLKSLESVGLECVMTHFAESDEIESPSVNSQLALFEELLAELNLSHLPKSLANSGAVFHYPDSHQDYVRPGIMLYGGLPSASQFDRQSSLRSVMSLTSAIISVRDVLEGETIGYGGLWVAERKSRIAVIACGYGDGYPRHAKNGTPVAVLCSSGECVIAPLVGRVSMDMLMIDITDVAKANVGTKVELWGQNVSADEVAYCSDTISYELFCNVTDRVPRVYHIES